MSEVVSNWDRVVHKNVRSKDFYDIGNIIQVTDNSIRIMQGATKQYMIPKQHVEGFNGSEVFLDLPFRELKSYKV